MTEFKAADLGAKFNDYFCQYKAITKQTKPILDKEWASLQRDLEEFNKQGFLTVAFVGEYSAGKSTIISALANRKDIKISADIATDKTAEYEWNSIKLIDTPGLFTERKDHDDITYEAIQKSDLLIFCLTHSLFDAITIENFKELAYDRKFRRKMMLLINKMSDEAGDTVEKITNYNESISSAIAPYDAGEFPMCFIDALDFIDGQKEEDDELIMLSRFDTFIKALNDFVESKAALAKLDTPIRIFVGSLNEAVNLFNRDESGDNAYLEILNRLSKAISRERERLSSKVKSISLKLSSQIVDEGVALANMVGGEENFEVKSKASEAKIQQLSQDASEKMRLATEEAAEELYKQVKDIYNSPLAENLYMHFERQEKINAANVEQDDSFKNFKAKSEKLTNIAGKVGFQIVKQATEGAKKAAAGGLLKTTEVAGGNLHNVVLTVGKFFGVNFKPWQAVNLAKSIGNVAKVVGPILSVLTLVLEGVEQVKENEAEVKLSEARREINTNFLSIAESFEIQFKKQFRALCEDLYGPAEKEIQDSRAQEESKIAQSCEYAQELLAVRKNIDVLLGEIDS